MNRLKNSNQLISYFQTFGKNEKSPHVYIIHEREFIRLNEPTYKIGETKHPRRRFSGYAKSSELVYFCPVEDSLVVERIAKQSFKTLFQQKQEYGQEYFHGDVNQMMNEFDRIISQCYLAHTVTPGLRFLLKKIFKPLPSRPHINRLQLKLKKSTPPKKVLPPAPTEMPAPQQVLSNHPNKKIAKFKCPNCPKILSCRERVVTHLAKKIPCDFKCRVCDLVLADAIAYIMHSRINHK